MTTPDNRRNFLAQSTVAATGLFLAGRASGQEQEKQPPVQQHSAATGTHGDHMQKMDHAQHAVEGEYPRTRPGYAGPIGGPQDRGRLVSGLRAPDEPPVPIIAPDLKQLEWSLVDGVKEFHLIAEPVRRELLPGLWIDTYGYNGDMPGPTIEVNRGDRVRIVVHNNLPEPTSMHWHGVEVPNDMDGVPHLVQNLIPPGDQFVYEFSLHQEGTFFYHSHVGMQETMGMVGLFIIHPQQAHQPAVDRDFVLIAQEFQIRPNSTVPDTLAMEWNYLTFNGRCGPLTTPMLCKLGERVRIRFVNFSVIDHHPLHLHGVTFWVTGTEGGRMPEASWYPSNNVLVGVAQAREIEFIANNPGDWILHCHMFHHMMNSMTSPAGPLIRQYSSPEQLRVKGYPQVMLGMEMPGMDGMKMDGTKMPHAAHAESQDGTVNYGMQGMDRVEGRREAIGMRPGWSMGVEGLSTVVRILPPEMYEQITSDKGHEGHKMHESKK